MKTTAGTKFNGLFGKGDKGREASENAMYDLSTPREFARLDGEIKRLRTLMGDIADELSELGVFELGEIAERLRAGRLPGAPRVPSFGEPATLWTSPNANVDAATIAPPGAR